jgi:hypothetical protein
MLHKEALCYFSWAGLQDAKKPSERWTGAATPNL